MFSCRGGLALTEPGQKLCLNSHVFQHAVVRNHAVFHCNFPLSLQPLCPDKDDLIHVSLHAGPELNPPERALVQSSLWSPSAQQLLLPGARLEEAKWPSAHLHTQPRHRPPNRVRHEEELIALAYFPEEK